MLSFHPVTPERWKDFTKLFGPRGACGGCWCTWWRITRSEFEKRKGEKNRRAMKRIIDSGEVPGILAYDGTEPVGWCSVAPREAFPVLERSRVLKRIDDKPVWSVVCFFIHRRYRRKGISLELLREAVRYAASQGARIVEGYPVEPKKGTTADLFAFTGLSSTFLQAGFKEAARRSETRPIMRYEVQRRGGTRSR
ncbi:MAG: GNAT family N-acetyltransferase [bacterium]|nr:MAG: GNAT family N-acetyltransferase [bacterium]